MAWLEKRNGKYFIAWREGKSIRRTGGDEKGWTDKVVARKKFAQWETDRARGEAGLVDPYKAHRNRPLPEHVADYVADLEAKGRDDVYVYNCEKLLTRLFNECEWKLLGDISADGFCNWRESIPTIEDGDMMGLPVLSPRSQNQYLCAVRTFCKWAVKRVRMGSNPMLSVDQVDETADVRRARRAATDDEANALLAVDSMSNEHKLVYRFWWATGLRVDETAKLLWGDLHLDCTTPYVALRAKATKARRNDVLPLHTDIVKSLKESRGDASDADRVFPSVPTLTEHKEYLAAAEIEYRVDGKQLDRHAQRTTFVTNTAKIASPNETKELARHTDMRLTLKHYVDPKVFNLTAAVNRLSIPGNARKGIAKVG